MSDQRIDKDLARTISRESLARSESFHRLGLEEQKEAYLDLYRSNLKRLSHRAGGTSSAPDPFRDFASTGRERVGDFIDAVDFPAYVQDLLVGVFQANLDATMKQMEAYADLLKEAARSVSDFIDDIDDSEAFEYLAENEGDKFGLGIGEGADERETRELRHRNPSLRKIDPGKRRTYARLKDVKIRMAQEQRALLREIIVIYIRRLALEEGSSS